MNVFSEALSGVTVVALEQAVAAPFCSSRLADGGARVIKIERPEGDFARGYDTAAGGESAYFVWLNRGKESLCLDLKRADDLALMQRIVGSADVFVQNLAPGAAQRLGLGSADLCASNQRLITVDISGYGSADAYTRMKAYDLLIQCEAGLASITGGPEAPGRVGVSVCDIACGMYAHAAVLQALLARSSSGHGYQIEVSLFDAIADWMAVPLVQFESGLESKRLGLNHPTIAPYGAYACAGGDLVVFSIQNQREWRRLCEQVLQTAELADDPLFAENTGRIGNRSALDQAIDSVLGALTRDEACARLTAADIAYGAVNGLAELAQHPALRRQVQPLAQGSALMVASAARVFETRSAEAHSKGRHTRSEQPSTEQGFRPVPALGQHTAAIRDEFDPATDSS